MAEGMVAGARRGGEDTGDLEKKSLDLTKSKNTGRGRGLVRGLLVVMEGRGGATGETSLLPTNFSNRSSIPTIGSSNILPSPQVCQTYFTKVPPTPIKICFVSSCWPNYL